MHPATVVSTLPELIRGLAIIGAFLVAAIATRRVVIRQMRRAAALSPAKWDDVAVAALRGPSMFLVIISTIWVAGRFTGLLNGYEQAVDQFMRVGSILAIVFFLDRLLRGAIDLYQEQLSTVHLTRGLSRALVRLFVVLLGTLVILDTLHISITPLLASLGIGGLALGLALQGTLSNLFAGMQIISDRPVRIGDFVKLQSGEEGYITEIGWRSTRLRMLPNNLVIVPNSKLADSIVTNYDLPDREVAVVIQVGVSYDSDLDHVERVTREVGLEVQREIPGAVAEFEPFIRYSAFENSSISFSVILRANQFVDNYLIRHEFIKRLHSRYRAENITIPFPIRTLDLSGELLKRLDHAMETGNGDHSVSEPTAKDRRT